MSKEPIMHCIKYEIAGILSDDKRIQYSDEERRAGEFYRHELVAWLDAYTIYIKRQYRNQQSRMQSIQAVDEKDNVIWEYIAMTDAGFCDKLEEAISAINYKIKEEKDLAIGIVPVREALFFLEEMQVLSSQFVTTRVGMTGELSSVSLNGKMAYELRFDLMSGVNVPYSHNSRVVPSPITLRWTEKASPCILLWHNEEVARTERFINKHMFLEICNTFHTDDYSDDVTTQNSLDLDGNGFADEDDIVLTYRGDNPALNWFNL